jgi:hypothetical protein
VLDKLNCDNVSFKNNRNNNSCNTTLGSEFLVGKLVEVFFRKSLLKNKVDHEEQ